MKVGGKCLLQITFTSYSIYIVLKYNGKRISRFYLYDDNVNYEIASCLARIFEKKTIPLS